MKIRKAIEDDLPGMNRLCMRSKAVWGYDEAFMEACQAELFLGPDDIRDTKIAVAEVNGRMAGMAQIATDGATAELEKIFVDPDTLSGGVGRALFEWALREASAMGASVLEVDSDPNAAPFYRRMGMTDIGVSLSGSVPGRELPRLRCLL